MLLALEPAILFIDKMFCLMYGVKWNDRPTKEALIARKGSVERMINPKKIDSIENALIVGMSLDDAYLFAGLTSSERSILDADDELQTRFARTIKQYEFSLLGSLNQIIEKQVHTGREGAVTWMLSKVNPARYGTKAESDGTPDIHLHLDTKIPEDAQVEIHRGSATDSRIPEAEVHR